MGKPARVLLVNPLSLYGGLLTRGASPVQPGLLSIASYLAAHGVPVEVLDLQLEGCDPRAAREVDEARVAAAELVLARDFDLLAISCNSSFHYLGAIDLARRVRAHDPALPIVVGGSHATVVPEDFAGPGAPFDVVVRGEGEVTLAKLARRPPRGGQRVRVVDGEPLPLDRPYLDVAGYPYWEPGGHMLLFPLSRGCPGRCVFCAGGRSRWRAYPVDAALSVVRTMMAARPQVLALCDACFGRDAGWRRDFLEGLARLEPSPAVRLSTRVDQLSASDLDGVRHLDLQVELGLETGSPRMAELMGKARDGERYVRDGLDLVDRLVEGRVLTHLFFIFNHPGETRETLAQSLEVARSLPSRSPPTTVFLTSATYLHLPGTAIAADLDRWRRETGLEVRHPTWWRDEGPQAERAIDVRTGVSRREVSDAIDEMIALRGRIVTEMPLEARFAWRRHRAPIELAPSSSTSALTR